MLFRLLLSLGMALFVLLTPVRSKISPRPASYHSAPAAKPTTPRPNIIGTPSALLVMPTPWPTPSPTPTSIIPWGQTQKVSDHLYRTFVGEDPKMGSPTEILAALNSYRADHHLSTLTDDLGLCRLAQSRAEAQDKLGTLDQHQGLSDYFSDPRRWAELGIRAIGENASFGYTLSGVHLIEWVFDADAEHRENQQDPKWNLACAGIAGSTVDIIFGER